MSVPPAKRVGWRFQPTRFELINDFLKPKTLGDEDEDMGLLELRLCEFEPHELLAQSKISDDYEGYFFCPRDFKYSNSQRSNRKTKTGFWKPTGNPLKIEHECTKKVIGTKRTLVFYENAHPKRRRSIWVAEEYEYIQDSNLRKKRDFVLIKVKKNPEKNTGKNESTQSTTLIPDLEGEPCMASDCENQNPNEMAVISPFEETELTHHVTSDFENQNLGEVLVNSSYCLDNANPKEITAISTDEGWLMASDLENQLSSSAFDGECSCPMKMSSVFKIQSLMDSDFENQNPNGTTANSPCESNRRAAFESEKQISFEFEGEWSSSIGMPSDFKNQSPYNKGELNSSVTSDFENQNPNEITTNSFYIDSESVQHMASYFKNQNPEECIPMSAYGIMASVSENQLSPFEFEGVWSPLVGMSADFKNESPYDKGMTFDFGKHLEKKFYVQDSVEGKCCPLAETSSDFDFPNPSEPKMSTYCGDLTAASPKNHSAQSILPELDPEELEEIEAFSELANILNCQPQPPMPN